MDEELFSAYRGQFCLRQMLSLALPVKPLLQRLPKLLD